MNIQNFSVEFEGHNLQGDLFGESNNDIALLFLHGAGDGNKKRYLPIREKLLKDYGISSYALDLIGHGETGGDLLGSSLEQRTNQVLAFVSKHIEAKKVVLVGASMSGYTSIKLSEYLDVSGMILLVPGIYDDKAYSIPFGKAFSEVIRQKESWKKSDALEIIKEYRGNLLVLTSEHDTVIPKDLVPLLMESAKQVKHKEHIEMLGAPHKLVAYLGGNQDELNRVTSKIADLYNNTSDLTSGILV